jgi:ubiquinone/menaquinone biosynthesis C-methylase UbiE
LEEEFILEDFQNADYGQIELNYNAFMRSAYRTALHSLALPLHSHGLDVGCGPGGLFSLLDEALDSTGTIVGCDISHPHLALSKRMIEQYELQSRVSLHAVDLREPLPFEDNQFDWAWSADVLWPMFFPQPVEIIKELRRVVKPGGIIAIFFANVSRSLILPGYDEMEQYLCIAVKQKSWGLKNNIPEISTERANSWLQKAGLIDVRISSHIAYHQAPLNDDVNRYLEDFAMLEYRNLNQEDLNQVGMKQSMWDTWQTISIPQSPQYILSQKDYYCALFGTLFSGHIPHD